MAQGIEKGIALYKKQQKEKQRQADRAKKKERKQKQNEPDTEALEQVQQDTQDSKPNTWLPWGLLLLSWIGFIAYTVVGIK